MPRPIKLTIIDSKASRLASARIARAAERAEALDSQRSERGKKAEAEAKAKAEAEAKAKAARVHSTAHRCVAAVGMQSETELINRCQPLNSK